MLSLPGLEIYPSKRKVFRDRQEIQLTAKEYEILLLLAANKGHVLTYSQIYEKVWGDIPSGCESNTIGFHICTCGRSCTRQLPMLPLPSDPSGKLDIALRYKQRNKSQQSDPLRLLFFFSILHNLYLSCILRQYVKPPGRDAADVDQQLLQEPDHSIRYRCSRTPMRGIE